MMKSPSPFLLLRVLIFSPFKGDHNAMAHRDIGRYSDHPPAFRSQPVHPRLGVADTIDLNAILVHGSFLPALFILLQPDHVEQVSGSNKQQADHQHRC